MKRKVILICFFLVGLALIAIPVWDAYSHTQPGSTENDEIELVDSDGDEMNDWFEANVAQTDPYVYNARFVILVFVSVGVAPLSPLACDPRVTLEIMEFFVEKEKIPAENVILLVGNCEDGATLTNFREAVSEVAQRADEESLVFVYLSSHGGGVPPRMDFADGEGHEYGASLTYEEVGEMLNEVECNRMLVAVFSCAQETALPPLAREAPHPRAVVWAARELLGAMGERVTYQSISDVIYGNRDGYVSLEEAITFIVNDYDLHSGAGDVEESGRLGKIINDESNIAPILYFGDYIPLNYAYNREVLTELQETGEYHGWYGCWELRDW